MLILLLHMMLIQPKTDVPLMGKWQQTKIVIDGELFYDRYDSLTTQQHYNERVKRRAANQKKYFDHNISTPEITVDSIMNLYSNNGIDFLPDSTCNIRFNDLPDKTDDRFYFRYLPAEQKLLLSKNKLFKQEDLNSFQVQLVNETLQLKSQHLLLEFRKRE